MYADILILAALSRRAQHGYELKKTLEESFGGFFPLTNSLLYPTLQRLEASGAVQREVVRQEGKPDRHLYHVTNRWGEIMQALLTEFPPEAAKRDAEFLVRVAFFGLIEPEARLAILRTRQAVLTQRHANLPRLQASHPQLAPYLDDVLSFRARRFQQELDWIAGLITQQETLLYKN